LHKLNKLLDISLPIGQDYTSWPGFESYKLTHLGSTSEGAGFFLTRLTLLTQIATHIDAPSHYLKAGKSIDEIPIDVFMGKARLLDLSSVEGSIITAQDCIRQGQWTERVLLKTRASKSWHSQCFPCDYPVLEKQAVDYLSSKGVRILVTDTPSVDEFSCKSPRIHLWLSEYDIYIMESAYLFEAEEGYYELIALPLNLKGADGSPVRAVLHK